MMLYSKYLLSNFKKKNISKLSIIEGTVKSTRKGYGFLENSTRKTYFIPIKYMQKVIHGDRILGRILIEKNREIIVPEKLIESSLHKFIGCVSIKENSIYIKPNIPYTKKIILNNTKRRWISKIKNGDWVLAKLTNHFLRDGNYFVAKVIKFIVEKINPLAPWYIVLSKHNLAKKEPDFSLSSINLSHIKAHERVDLTNLDFITIDNQYTKDIDDALFIEEKLYNTLILTVAIADPTQYISKNSELDFLARSRSFTNYLPGLSIPMLPKYLAENLCSLKPNVKRPVIACRMILNQDGQIDFKNVIFFLAWIKSKSKLSYENVSNWLEKIGTWTPKNPSIIKQIILLKKLYYIRYNWRQKNALIFPEQPEYRFHFSENLTVSKISLETRRIAHKIVEESMIAANISAAFFLKKNLGFGIYNIHSGFDGFNAANISDLLTKYNIFFPPEKLISFSGFCELFRKLELFSDHYLLYRIRKAQSLAELSLIPKPHYALGFTYYATWTSPIRKYSDIINHRLIKSIILGEKNIVPPQNSLITYITKQKRKIRLAVRELEELFYINFFQNIYSKDRFFQANIIDILYSGIKARLLKNGAFIFIPINYIHKIKEEIFLKPELGLVYIKNQVFYRTSDIVTVYLLNIKVETKTIIASLI